MSNFTIESIGDDIIDVRDIIARVEELQEQQSAYQSAKDEADEARANVAHHHSDVSEAEALQRDFPECEEARQLIDALEQVEPLTEEEAEELAKLEEILSDLCGNGGDEQWNGDWYPVTLINESYFEEAMDELLEDIGDIPKNIPSYLKIVVDYDALKMDYTSTDINGETYWYR